MGAVAKAHGIRGELKVFRYNKDSDLLLQVDRVALMLADGLKVFKVLRGRVAPKTIIMALAGIKTRNAAEELRNVEVCVHQEDLPPANEDEMYLHSLLHCEVQQQDKVIGEVVDVMSYPSVVCVRVKMNIGFVEIPLLDQWVATVDVERQRVVVHDIDDLPVEEFEA